MKRLSWLACLFLFTFNAAGLSVPVLFGHFSLQGGIPKSEGHLRVTRVAGDPLREHIDLWITAPHSDQPIHDFVLDMTKRLHLVIISSDFSVFLDIHPPLGPDGHFILDQQFPAPGLYYLYADGEPGKFDNQVFRFDVVVGNVSVVKPRTLVPTGRTVNTGPYTVELSQTKLSVGGMDTISVHILKGGKSASDLHPYLGTLAHAVFLNSKDLTYVHVHPMAMGRTPMDHMEKSNPGLPNKAVASSEMMLHVGLQEPGTYKLWLQFRGGGRLYIAPFVLTAQYPSLRAHDLGDVPCGSDSQEIAASRGIYAHIRAVYIALFLSFLLQIAVVSTMFA